jgi:NAD(P)-dependent dehydrogenase (short-subunit alcohol dehydrogenase family)
LPTEAISTEEYRRVLEVNLVAPFVLAKAFGEKMLERRRSIHWAR